MSATPAPSDFALGLRLTKDVIFYFFYRYSVAGIVV